jgi:1-acyl-sn-glycerol-3-phosphate acyltransferase
MRVPACGRVLPRHEIRVVDEQGCELPDRRVGCLQFRGPSATAGYYRNPLSDASAVSRRLAGLRGFCLYRRRRDLSDRPGQGLDHSRRPQPLPLRARTGGRQPPGVRRGCVAVFASNDPVNATERLIVLAETREEDPTRRETLRQCINDAAVAAIGMPADEVVLAPPNSVLKTSSGKIRRNASREAFERGLIGIRAVPARRQMLRLALAALRERLRDSAERLARRVYGIWCWSVFLMLAVPVLGLVVALRVPALGRRVVHHAARIFLRLAGMSVASTAAAESTAGPHLLLVNHCSYFDALVLCAVLPPSAAYSFVAKREFVEQPVIHAFLRALGTLFVERFEATKSLEDVDGIVAALEQGEKVVIFPEGTFSREAGLKPFRMGAFVAAVRAGVPVRVSGLRGTRAVLRDRTWMPRRGPMSFEFGPLLLPVGGDWVAAVRLRERTRQEMLRLCGEHDLER